MSDPTPIRPVVSAELDARRARQKARGQAASDREYDQMAAELSACNGECTAPGSTRGGVQLGDGTITLGMVAVDERGEPLTAYPQLDGVLQRVRPCFNCNSVRWEAWQDGVLSRKARAKVESLGDRQLADQGRRKSREESFR